MKVLNISRFLPIKGFPAENDITLKIYADLRKEYGIESLFVMPLPHIPKWATYIKRPLLQRYKTVNDQNYLDEEYQLPVRFFQSFFQFPFLIFKGKFEIFNLLVQHPFYKKDLNTLFTAFQPDIIHAHTVFDAIYAFFLSKKYKTPYIITLRGAYTDIYKMPFIKKVINHAKKVVTPSAALKRDLNGLYHLELLPHGLNDFWYSDEQKKFNTKELRLISVARLQDWKNLQTVISAVAKLIHQGINVHYDIVGEGYYKEFLKDLVIKEGIAKHVVFHGFKSNEALKNIYQKNDIFILLSYPETFGRVYYEAAAQGLLIIGRKGTGIDGYFSKDEAFIINPDVDDTVKSLKSIDSSLFYKMTKNSKKRVREFSNEQIINRYFHILMA